MVTRVHYPEEDFFCFQNPPRLFTVQTLVGRLFMDNPLQLGIVFIYKSTDVVDGHIFGHCNNQLIKKKGEIRPGLDGPRNIPPKNLAALYTLRSW
jgi:hypothetical protein